MTAVEFLLEQLENYDSELPYYNSEAIIKAKEMEKQQIMNTYIIADSESTQEDSEHNALKFYERTYGSKGSDATSSQTTSDKWKEYQDWLNEVPEISDEEIEAMLFHHSNEYAYGFKDAIKWYREQLKQRQ